MLRLKQFSLLLFLLNCGFINAQIAFEKTFFQSGHDIGNDIQQTFDGGYIVVGQTSVLNGNLDISLIRLNEFGDTIWTRKFGGNYDDEGRSVIQTSDSGFLICGYIDHNSDKISLIKTDTSGIVQWSRLYYGPGNENGEVVIQTKDSGYLIGSSGNSGQPYLIKTDDKGDSLWAMVGHAQFHISRIYSIIEDMNGNFMVGGVWDQNSNDLNMFLTKFDTSGNMIWTKSYGTTFTEDLRAIRQTSDSGFILLGNSFASGFGGNDVMIIRLDSQGNIIWSNIYGDFDDEFGYSLQVDDDGGFIITGQTSSAHFNDKDGFVLKLNSTGSIVWNKIFSTPYEDCFSKVIKTSDHGLILTGYTTDIFSHKDILVVKSDSSSSLGCMLSNYTFQSQVISITTDTGYTFSPTMINMDSISFVVESRLSDSTICTNVSVNDQNVDNNFYIYPNPSNGYLKINGAETGSLVSIINITGECVKNVLIIYPENKIDISDLPIGFYIFNYYSRGKFINLKFIKEKF